MKTAARKTTAAKTARWALAAALALALGTPALAKPDLPSKGHYRIDPSSRIGFHVGQAAGSGISGTFPAVSGSFVIDPGDLSKSSVSVELRPESVSTGQQGLDAFLRSVAVFDAAEHPAITFRSTRVVQTGPHSATIQGMLTARGLSHPEAFQATLADTKDGDVAFHVTGDIFRTPYGMDVGTPIYSNVVNFDMQLKGVR